MASFTEQAILTVVDNSSAKIRKINAALKELQRTAKSLKSVNVKMNVDTGKLKEASNLLNTLARNSRILGQRPVKLHADTGQLKAASQLINTIARNKNNLSKPINFHVNTAGITRAQRLINALRGSAGRPFGMGAFVGGGVAGAAARGVWNATKEGTVQADAAKTNMDLLMLTKERRAAAEKEITKIEEFLDAYPGAQQFNRALISQRYAENLRQVREGEAASNRYRIPLDPKKPWGATRAATEDERRAESLKRMEQAAQRTTEEINIADQLAKTIEGMTPEQAIKKTQGYFKSLDMAQWLTDEAGNFSPEKMTKAGNFVRTLIQTIGEEATGQFLSTLVRREKAAKFGLSERGQLTAALIAEDMGPSVAGTALSSWMQQTHGRSITKAAMKAQVKAGMAKRTKGGGVEIVDSQLAMEDPIAYARERLIPALKTFGLTEQQIYSQSAKDMDKVSNALNKLYSNTNAAGFAQTLVTKLQEIEKSLIDAESRPSDAGSVRIATQNSINAAYNAMQGQFKSMMGQAVVAFGPTISNLGNTVAKAFQDNAEDIRLASEGDVGAGVRAGAKFAGATAAAVGSVWVLRKLLAETGAAGAMGWTSGIMAMMSDNEGVRALGGAGVSLIEAADALKSAAAAMGGPDIDLPGGKGGPEAGPHSRGSSVKVNRGPLKMLKNVGRIAGKALIGLGGASLVAGGFWQVFGPEISKEYANVPWENIPEQVQRNIISDLAGRRIGEAQKQTGSLTEQIDRTKKQIERRPETGRNAVLNAKANEAARKKLAELEGKRAALAAEIIDLESQRQRAQMPDVPEPVIPTEPGATPGVTPKPAPTVAESLATLIPQLAKTAESITVAVTSLTSVDSTFQSVFAEGAAAINNAGTTAASTMQGAAAGIGQTIGSTAAEAIRSAVAGLTVNVNANVSGGTPGDPGRQTDKGVPH